MTAKKAYAHLLDISKRHKHRNLHKFLQNSEIISIDARVDTSLSLKYFLIKTVIGQQVSVKAAQSIWLKVKNVLDKTQQPITIELLKKQGLSKPKAAYIFGIINNKFIEEATIANLKKLSLHDLSHFF